MMLEAIKQVDLRSQIMDVMVCESRVNSELVRKESCMLGTCPDCRRPDNLKKNSFEQLLYRKLEEKEIDEFVTYSQWHQVDGRTKLLESTCTVSEFVDTLYTLFCSLLPHHYISSVQAAQFKEMRSIESISSSTAIIQVDFAENYSFVIQDEAQGFHWDTTQATIHPFCAWFKIGEEIKVVSASIISDERRHDTETVFAFQKSFLDWFLKEYPTIKAIEYWSDGCAGQYKNFKNFTNLNHHAEDFGVPASWHFFATSHGKGAVDGISAAIKASARRHSLRVLNKGHILTPLDLYEYCAANLENIKFIWLTAEHVASISNQFQLNTRFSSSSTYPQTRMCHRLASVDKEIRMFRTSKDSNYFFPSGSKTSELHNTFKVEDWVAVRYLSTWYLSIVKEVNEEVGLLFVHFADKPGSCPSYKFSGRLQHNTGWVKQSEVITEVTPKTSGGTSRTMLQYTLTEKDRSLVESLL
jgi:hypothetical protein